LRKHGRVRSIGVSNFTARQLERIIGKTGVVPALNQVELHPVFQQRSLREFQHRYKIATEAWSPLGQGKSLNIPPSERLRTATGERRRRSSCAGTLKVAELRCRSRRPMPTSQRTLTCSPSN
jgi:diketogulonate reductase-like aldo/keto reductase